MLFFDYSFVFLFLPATLGEDAVADAEGIRRFASEHLADFKVPRKVLIVDEIPKGATGKLQRIGLADKLGLTA